MSLTDFAEYLDVSQALISKWYRGQIKQGPEPGSIKKLVERFGDEVYDAVGLTPPSSETLDPASPEEREALITAIKETNSIYATGEIAPESPEAFTIAVEVFAKYGIILRRKNRSG